MKITLVAKPADDGGSDLDHLDDLAALVADAGHEVDRRSRSDGRASLLQDPGDLLVAVGGDGTVREVALVSGEAGRPFAILPFGTANNIAKTLGIVGDARAEIASWDLDAAQPFDLGQVEGSDRFVEAVGGGLFADLLRRSRRVEESATLLGRETDRALAVLVEILRYARPARWGVTVDGRDCSGDYLAVEVLNVRFAGPNVPIAPAADPGDGRLDVVLVGEQERSALVGYLEGRLALASGTLPPLPVVSGGEIELRPPDGMALRLDDERLPASDRLAIRCLSGAANVVGRH